ncbi:type II toxin-antitoxin system HicB family antitoxin [Moraxellaceae bacterium AER2_44_116]|nr:type II toxin-antitoxin system HicB family antitoxin [Moraxellaceae bacterium]TQC98380.1 type II toxin-antitoxin system HicB family antitoxin [Moraxellaceae bacterium AER2_44_116]
MLYPIAIELGDDTHAYGVTVPDIEGCFSAGDTMEESLNNVREAIEFHLEGLVEDGQEIPLPTDMAKHQQNPDFAVNYIWAIVDIDVSRFMGKAEKINVTLPSRLIHLIDNRVTKDSRYKSRSGFLAAGAELLLRG